MSIPQEMLMKILRYDEKTGRLFWLPRPRDMFNAECTFVSWNRRNAGNEAFMQTNIKGYLAGKVMGKSVTAHRVIWCMAHGTYPIQIDHIDGNKTNNLLSNLRAVTNAENQKNRPTQKNSSTGLNGVTFNKKLNKFQAYITINKRRVHIGTFETALDAQRARNLADFEHGFHRNHGRAG